MTDSLALDLDLPPQTSWRIGRARTRHIPRVLIRAGTVEVETRCGLAFDQDTWQHVQAAADCPACIERLGALA